MSEYYHEEYKNQGNRPYSAEVKDAVRYAYQYRAATGPQLTQFVCFLPELPGVFCWLAKTILDGIVYDAFKGLVRETFSYLKQHRRKIDPLTNRILTDPAEIRRFYDYINEFKDKKMNLTDKERRCIVEGFVADITKKKAERIYESTGRFPTAEEYAAIQNEAFQTAERLLSDWTSGTNRPQG